jgi:hypothetical protein
MAKLTDELVIRARQLSHALILREVYELIGVPCNKTVLRFAITGRTWKHLDTIEPPVIKPKDFICGKKVPKLH